MSQLRIGVLGAARIVPIDDVYRAAGMRLRGTP
jgi:hypothetical protein